MVEVDIVVEDDRWDAFDLQPIADRAVEAVMIHLGLEGAEAEVAILACDDTQIAGLNADFRDKPKATNVLSWPAVDLSAHKAGDLPDLPEADIMGQLELGDIAISYDTCAAEAAAAAKPMQDHVMHLLIHAALHLLGYDHVRDQDATLMENLEIKILENMGIDNPYNDEAAI